MAMAPDRASVIALNALGWLATTDDLLQVFLGSTGASQDDLRQNAEDAGFQGSVLDFLMMDDAWIVAFCDAHSLPYESVQQARFALPGGGEVHWT